MRTAVISKVFSRRSVPAFLTFATIAGLFLGCQQSASATPLGPGAKPPRATVGQYDRHAAPAPAGPASAWELTKEQQAGAHYTSLVHAATADRLTAATTTSRNLAVAYQTQVNGYYCGPATFAMVSAYRHVGWSGSASTQQRYAASLLGTTSNGTAWYGSDNVPSFPYSSWYPMADAMNYRIYRATGKGWYRAAGVTGVPTSTQASAYEQRLTYDIDKSYPLMINQYSIPGYQFHWQPNGYWFHWLAVRGYSSTGSYSIINDPGFTAGHNATAASRGGRGSVIHAIGGRGYIW